MTEEESEDIRAVSTEVAAARREAAMALARLAEISMKYADVRTASDRQDAAIARPGRAKPGEFVADELSLMLREQPYAVRCLIARSRRLSTAMPTVWQAYRDGDLDAEQVRVIDRVARRVCEPLTLTAIDEQSVEAAQSRCPKQLAAWLLRLVVRLEPLAFEQRHRRALAERRVTVIQGVDGMGYVTGEVSAADAAAIDGMLAAAARSLGAQDPRTEQQRRSDLFADLLLGRLHLTDADEDQTSHAATSKDPADGHCSAALPTATCSAAGWRSKTSIQTPASCSAPICSRSTPTGSRSVSRSIRRRAPPAGLPPPSSRRPRQLRIGVIVPLSSLLGLSDAPGELADRSGLIPGSVLREPSSTPSMASSRDEVVFTRLLTDDGGRLMDTTELGRYASARLAQAIQRPCRNMPIPVLQRPRRPLRS